MLVPLRIAAAQPKLTLDDIAANIERHVDTIAAAKCRVVVFPELSLTGYSMHVPALTIDDERLGALIEAARRYDCVALVGAPLHDRDGTRYIGTLRIDDEGATVAYRKMFLGDTEALHFSAGPSPEITVVDGWRLGLAICKDLRIVEHERLTMARNPDVYVAGTVKNAAEAIWQRERAQAIAIARRCWVVVSSFAGPTGDGFDDTAGESQIWSPGGVRVACASRDVDKVAIGELHGSPG